MNTVTTSITDAEFAAQLAQTLGDLHGLQTTFKKQRGKGALAHMVAQLFVTASRIIANVDEGVRELILDQYQIKSASGNTSKFSPWIAMTWGEDDPKADKVEAIDKQKYPKWVPDKSMAVYFHAMEAALEAGYDLNSDVKDVAKFFLDAGGTQKVANKRKEDVNLKRKGLDAPTEEAARVLYREDGPAVTLPLEVRALSLPDDTSDVFTILVERQDGQLIYRGVTDKDATKRLTRLAMGKFVDLKAARDKAADEQRLRDEGAAAERARGSGAGTPDDPKRVSTEQLIEMVARTKAKVAAQG